MKSRRALVLALFAGLASTVLTVGTAFAAELVGKVLSANADEKKITVVEKDTDKEVVVTVNDDTKWVTASGKQLKKKPDLAKIKKGRNIKVTHEKGVASQIELEAGKKKAAPQNELQNARKEKTPKS